MATSVITAPTSGVLPTAGVTRKQNLTYLVWGGVPLLVLILAYAVPRMVTHAFDPPWTFPKWSAPAFAALAMLTLALPVAGWACYAIASDDASALKSANPWTALRLVFAKLVEGKDGRASTSKLQALLWFGMGLFAYLTTYFTRWLVQAAGERHHLVPGESGRGYQATRKHDGCGWSIQL